MKQFKFIINDKHYNVTVKKVDETIAEVEVNGTPYQVLLEKPAKKQAITIKRPLQTPTSTTDIPPLHSVKIKSGSAVKSPLPGVILRIDCKTGDTVKKGQNLLVLEAMKMENTIPSDRDGVISEIKVNAGDSVMEGADLVIIQ